MSPFKTKLWIPELGQGTLKTGPYISVFSKMYATSPLTLFPWSNQNIYFYAIKI